jgi:hypothetical protein
MFIIKERFDYACILIKNDRVYRTVKKSLLKYPKTEKEFTILKVHKYPLIEETEMVSVNLIKKSVVGGVTLIGLSLLSQPAQAIDWNFSYSTSSNSFFTGTLTSDGSSYAANTIYTLTGISGTVTDNGVDTSVSTVGSDFGADNLFVWNGTTGISLTGNGIGFYSSVNNRYRIYSPNGGFGSALGDFSGNSLTEGGTGSALTSSSLTPVPWETDALSVIGSTVLFAGGLWAKNKFAKPLQK